MYKKSLFRRPPRKQNLSVGSRTTSRTTRTTPRITSTTLRVVLVVLGVVLVVLEVVLVVLGVVLRQCSEQMFGTDSVRNSVPSQLRREEPPF